MEFEEQPTNQKLYRYQVRLRWLCSDKENANDRDEVANPPEHTPILQNRKLYKQYPWTETATGEDRENIAVNIWCLLGEYRW